MNRRRAILIGAFLSLAVLSVLVFLSQIGAISLPYLTPTMIEFRGLQEEYPVNGSMNYQISIKGFGSNCIGFTAETFHKDSSLAEGQERVAYFSKTDDCRKIHVSQGAYNYTQSFSYNGHVVLGHRGDYRVEVAVFDEITRKNYTSTRAFIVK